MVSKYLFVETQQTSKSAFKSFILFDTVFFIGVFCATNAHTHTNYDDDDDLFSVVLISFFFLFIYYCLECEMLT